MDIDQIKERLQKEIGDGRYQHCLRVAETAKGIAEKHGFDQEKAYLGGLLHDCAREKNIKELEKILKEGDVKLREDEQNCPGVWHAIAGGVVAKSEYGVEDSEILDAIIYHSMGDKDMGPIAQVVYIADIIEPERKEVDENFQVIQFLRTVAESNFDQALTACVSFKIQMSLRLGTIILSRAIELWNKLVTEDKRG
jgi:predicted HD superfamily hydrolase involved in NAD metabolism